MNKNSPLKFINYVVDKVEFKNNYEFSDEIEIDFDIDSNIEVSEDNKCFLKLSLELFKNKVENSPFSMSVDVIGVFEIDELENNEMKKEIIEKNTIAILFPYLRAIVSNYTALANITPLLLPPINVVEYINRKYKKEII